ncbi:hypothetical protein AAMO2058_000207800 [Amorphochlora amoebiformis]
MRVMRLGRLVGGHRYMSSRGGRLSRNMSNYLIGAGLITFVGMVYYRSISAVSRDPRQQDEIDKIQKELDDERALEKEISSKQ